MSLGKRTTGVTGLKGIRAIVAGQRDPERLAKLRDRRCKHSAAELALALDGRYRPEFLCDRLTSLLRHRGGKFLGLSAVGSTRRQ